MFRERMNFQIQQEKFEGPLELLVELIESEKLSISEISLSRVADDYIRYVKSLDAIDPESLAEFLVVAGKLMLIKSCALLPALELSETEELALEELEDRLAIYKRFRELAHTVRELEKRKQHILTREHYKGMDAFFYPSPGLSLDNLHHTLRIFLDALPKIEKLAEDKIRRIVSLEEQIARIRLVFEKVLTQSFSEIIKSSEGRADVVINFLAILELAKQKFIELDQDRLFGNISIKRILPYL